MDYYQKFKHTEEPKMVDDSIRHRHDETNFKACDKIQVALYLIATLDFHDSLFIFHHSPEIA